MAVFRAVSSAFLSCMTIPQRILSGLLDIMVTFPQRLFGALLGFMTVPQRALGALLDVVITIPQKILGAVIGIFVSVVCMLVSFKKLPPGLEEKNRTRVLFVGISCLRFMGVIREYLGFGSRLLFLRMIEFTSFVKRPRTTKGVKYCDTTFDGVRVRIYEPVNGVTSQDKRPAIIYYHGGGWAIANVEFMHPSVASICRRTQCLVVSVDFRRAPEYPYPAPLDDCVKATVHFFLNADTYQVDTRRVAVMGDSAGGNLAAAVALKLRDMQSPYQPRLQVLIQPITQILDLQLPSYQMPYQLLTHPDTLAGYIVLYTGLQNIDGNELVANAHISSKIKQRCARVIQYLPDEFRKGYTMQNSKEEPAVAAKFEKFIADPYISPLMATSLKDLPEAYIWTAEFDHIRDDGVMYANKLKHHGVKVTWVHKQMAIHGSWHFPFPSSRPHRKETCQFIKETLSA